MNLTSGKPRGCGERKAGDLYLCVGQSEGGKPIEHFMLDPPIPWHKGHFQGCELFTRSDGIVDIIMWVGAEHYPFIPDFIEEARHHGISKKIPRSGDYSMLTPFKSTLMLVHPRCIHNVQYNLKSTGGTIVPHISRPAEDFVPSQECDHHPVRDGIQCVFSNWDIAGHFDMEKHRVYDNVGGDHWIETPSVRYITRPCTNEVPEFVDNIDFQPGIFARFPITHFEFIGQNDEIPRQVANTLGDNLNRTAVVQK